MTAAAETPTARQRILSIAGGSAGNLVEWYDWYVYSAFTLYFAPVFFPAASRTAQLLNAAAIFAVGFVMRPVGAWAMGVYADRHGRKAALTVSVTLMCAGSLLIAAAPGYAAVGWLSPSLLLIARLLQGLSVGGEYGASAVYLSEMATRAHRGFWSSFQYVTLVGGLLVAQLLLVALQAVLGDAALGAWGWRVPFAIGGVLAVAVYRLRRRLIETPSYRAAAAAGAPRSSGVALVARYPREAALVVALTAGGTLAFYAYTTYMAKFLVNTAGFDRTTAAWITTPALALFALVQPAVGALSDRIGRRPLLIAFGIAGLAGTVPIFSALARTRDPLLAFALVAAALLIVSGYTAINAVVKAELFPAPIRTLGVALPYALANTLFGGTAEYAALWLKGAGWERGFYWYVAAMCGVSLLAYWRMRDTGRHSAIVEG